MFADAWDDSVHLGVPKSRPAGAAAPRDARVSRVGGSPDWLLPPPFSGWPPCRLCSAPQVFVGQVYAPVDSHRVLYIFGCNSAACSGTGDGWRVYRQEASFAEIPAAEAGDGGAPQRGSSGGAAASSTGGAPLWAADGATLEAGGGAWGAATSWDVSADAAWGDSDAVADAKIDAMMAALEGGIAAGAGAPADGRPAEAKRGGAADRAPPVLCGPEPPFSFPRFDLEIAAEPLDDAAAGAADEQRLLDKALQYLDSAAEDDADAQAVREAIAAKGARSTNSTNNDATDDEGEEDAAAPAPGAVGPLRRFQRRLAREPSQVLRYAWDAAPLWAGAAPADARRVRAARRGAGGGKDGTCRHCGAKRVFELQLMPQLLHLLRVEDGVVIPEEVRKVKGIAAPVVATDGDGERRKPAPAPSAAPRLSLASCGDCMDWAAVAVYSCEQSCGASGEEIAVVQKPIDGEGGS